jgi:hypothetical protein
MTATLASDKLTSEEVKQARTFLEQALNGVRGATKGLSSEQWTFKPTPNRWSIAEILDHVVIVQERVLGPVLDQLVNAPAPPSDHDPNVIDAIVINHFPNRLVKYTAPEFVNPLGSIAPAELLNRMAQNFERLSDSLQSRNGLRQHAAPAPPLQAVSKGAYTVMDGYQWILAAGAHTERHTKQMLEVKADPGYPI